jgi:hypothetical protein
MLKDFSVGIRLGKGNKCYHLLFQRKALPYLLKILGMFTGILIVKNFKIAVKIIENAMKTAKIAMKIA